MYLYSMTWPAGSVTVPFHRGLLEVYSDASRATALLVSQFPRAPVLPTILIVWPYFVVTSSLNVTATDVAAWHEEVVVAVVVEEGGLPVVELVTLVGGTPV